MNSNQEDKMQEIIESYLNDVMSKEERAAFEGKMQEDKALKEEVLMYKALQESFNENDWHNIDKEKEDLKKVKDKLQSDDFQNLSKTIRETEQTYLKSKESKSKFSNRYAYLAIAASIILFVSIIFPFMFNDTLGDYYNEYEDWGDIPSMTEKGAEDGLSIESLYASEKYDEIISYYETNTEATDALEPYSLMKVGFSYFHNDQYKKALETFDVLIQLDSLESSRGYWYKLLVYLKEENEMKAKETLDIIISDKNNHNYKEAVVLSKKLK